MTPNQHFDQADKLLAEAEVQSDSITRALDRNMLTTEQLRTALSIVSLTVARAHAHAIMATVPA